MKKLIYECIALFLGTSYKVGEYLDDMDNCCPFCNNVVEEYDVCMVDGYEYFDTTWKASCPECGASFHYNDCMGYFLSGFPTKHWEHLV